MAADANFSFHKADVSVSVVFGGWCPSAYYLVDGVTAVAEWWLGHVLPDD